MTVTDDFMAGLDSTNAPLDRPTGYERARGGAALSLAWPWVDQ
jgi:hypothetical protein